ncbi:zinc finger protein [Saccharopolyspora sp. NPDC000359]|uniref:zinc finger protein n=1 Tax=Saccharopolyspora sp. NPDC000359 TaxID=3154251 RepID=UPI00332FD645
MSDYLTYVWRPITGGRHAFPVAATKSPPESTVDAYCGAQTEASQLHNRSEVDWIREPSCKECWRILAKKPS